MLQTLHNCNIQCLERFVALEEVEVFVFLYSTVNRSGVCVRMSKQIAKGTRGLLWQAFRRRTIS